MRSLLIDAFRSASAGRSVIAFPPAGAGTEYFHRWISCDTPEFSLVPVRLPGRQDLWDQAPMDSMRQIVDHLADELAERSERTSVILGICSGGLMAYELAHRLLAADPDSVRALVLNATPLPAVASSGLLRSVGTDGPFLSQADSEVLRESFAATEYGKFSERGKGDDTRRAALLDEIWELAEPRVRADIHAVEFHDYELTPLEIPITAVHGEFDDAVGIDTVRQWADYTSAGFEIRALEGGHSLIADCPTEFAREINNVVRAAIG
ncbi:thioesterase II family protein [Nocardia asiatica]|uniref:thioesterase II family protein n=1 Tax=Nocardia asiatica TaxID=209252 RepID=UPI002457356E|nr:alpha/beta fold hydrolase [Nocardia asiatica]